MKSTFFAAAVLLLSSPAFAEDESKEELQQLRQRVENLERGQQVDDEKSKELMKTLQKGKKFQEEQQEFLDQMERDGEL